MKKKLHSVLAKSLILSAAFFSACTYNDFPVPVDCTASDLTLHLDDQSNPTVCNAIDGTITVSATGGEGPYNFSLNGGSYQTSGSFIKLAPGSFTLEVKDVHGCTRSLTVDLSSSNSTLTATVSTTADTDCFSDNGSISINASQGKPPYHYQLGSGAFGEVNTFGNLKFGNYTVTVKDGDDCPRLINVTIPRGNSSVSYVNDIKPILDTNCNVAGCHNGSLGATRDWRTYANVKDNAAFIKTRTANKTMPPSGPLTQKQIDQITCWVDDGALNN